MIADPLIELLRPIQIKGKGFFFDPIVPRHGNRTVKVAGDYAMDLDLANVIHRQIFMGCFGRLMTRCTRALLSPGSTFLDVGANIGYFTLLASRQVGREGHVHAIEPNQGVFSKLQHHIIANRIDNVSLHSIALAESSGQLRLYVPPSLENRDYNVTCLARGDWIPIDVVCKTLNQCWGEWGLHKIELMKMDVEGAEPRILAGGKEPLKQGLVRHIITEINGGRLSEAGSSPAELVVQLKDLGFLPARLSSRRAIPVSTDKWDLHPEHEYDRLFVHETAL